MVPPGGAAVESELQFRGVQGDTGVRLIQAIVEIKEKEQKISMEAPSTSALKQ